VQGGRDKEVGEARARYAAELEEGLERERDRSASEKEQVRNRERTDV